MVLFQKELFCDSFVYNTMGFTHIDYVSNDIEISMTYQSDKHIVSRSCATP